MNVNGVRFHLLLGESDWSQSRQLDGSPIFGAGSPLAWDRTSQEVTLAPRTLRFESSPHNRAPRFEDRRGAAADRFGNWYWIDADATRIMVQSAGSKATSLFWSLEADAADCPPPPFGGFAACVPSTPATLQFSGLAVTEDHYLAAGVLDPPGLVVFDLQHGDSPRQVVWPPGIPFTPFDMSPAPEGGIWIYDRINARLWRMNRYFSMVSAGQPTGSSPAFTDLFETIGPPETPRPRLEPFPSGFAVDAILGVPSAAIIAVEGLPDGSVLFLETEPAARFSRIHHWMPGHPIQTLSADRFLNVISLSQRSAFALAAHDFAFLPVESTPAGLRFDTLFLTGSNGDQTYAFQLSRTNGMLALDPYADYFPMRLFGGKGIVAAAKQVYYDSGDRWIPVVHQRRPRYRSMGELITPALDGKEPGCLWDRLLVDGCFPPGSLVEVATRAHDDATLLPGAEWRAEPAMLARSGGPEMAWEWRLPQAGVVTAELLFQQARGQFLQIRLLLSGDGRSSPRLRALRAWYPRFSYLERYLPPVYREDEAAANFLDRFLSNPESFYTALEDRLAAVQSLADPRIAPPETLDWLASWFGVALDPAWTPEKRRLFLRHAMDFFQARGTVPGLMMALRLVMEPCADESVFENPRDRRSAIRIVEKFRSRPIPPLALTQPSTAALPLQVRGERWRIADGAAELDQLYRDALGLPADAIYPLRPADAGPRREEWEQFSLSTFGFIPVWSQAATALWREFMERRYVVFAMFKTAHLSAATKFPEVDLPLVLPTPTAAIWDWYQFQGVVLPMRESAHRFTVYLPLTSDESLNPAARERKVSLARRVIDLEKPAHTLFDIQSAWSAFRLGEARLQDQTVVDLGSRAPEWLRPFSPAASGIGAAYLASGARQRPFLSTNCSRKELQ